MRPSSHAAHFTHLIPRTTTAKNLQSHKAGSVGANEPYGRAYSEPSAAQDEKDAQSVSDRAVSESWRNVATNLHRTRKTCKGLTSACEPYQREPPYEALSAWLSSRLVSIRNFLRDFSHVWKRAIEKTGMRYIPPNMLRHTSETIMQAAELPDTLASRMHGRTELQTDHHRFMRPGGDSMEMAAHKVAGFCIK